MSISYLNEIKQIMFSFGDSPDPLNECVEFVNKVILEQLNMMIGEACLKSQTLNNKNKILISPEDVLYVIRTNKLLLRRLYHYYEVQNSKRKLIMNNFQERETLFENYDEGLKKNKYNPILKLIENYDEFGICKDPSVVDQVKQERYQRQNLISMNLSHEDYEKYCIARRISFLKKNSVNFKKWLNLDENLDLYESTVEILMHLTYEMIANIVNLSLKVREERILIEKNNVTNISLATNSKICNTYFNEQNWNTNEVLENYKIVIADKNNPIKLNEIKEALRRLQYSNIGLNFTDRFNFFLLKY